MIKILLLSVVLDISYIVCVTRAAMFFNNPKILWWYLLVLIIGSKFRFGATKHEEHSSI